MRRARRKAGNKDKVFGCDLLEHLSASSQEVPQVLRSCSEFIEEHGVVDGIYRLSGVSSNIQKLRNEFDNEGIPDLNKDVYQQDIHCVSSLCKAYFRELPNPLLTYQLYDKFAEAVAIQLEEDRLVKIRDVLKELPPLHNRTLEVLMRHLVKMASYSSQTNMHSRNLAIVWAPNLLRSKDIEASGFNGTAAFMEVRVQSIVVEFILTHVPQLFPEPGVSTERRKSLPSPSVLSNQEETLFRTVPFHFPTNIGNISPGDGPLAIRSYHAIIEGTDKRKGSLKGRKWRSIFNLGGRIPDPRRRHKNSTKEKEKPTLRPAKSMDSLSCDTVPYPHEVSRQRPPSSHISPLALVSSAPQASTEGGVSGSSVGGSGYAVTYRRGAGASVSVVSGGGGVQGTYSLLDSGGTGGNGTDAVPTQNRSPGLGSKAGRRVGMHITGPLSVTVPLHITSGLALGVLGGGGDRVLPRTRQWSGGAEEEGRDVGGSKVSGADTMGGDVEPKEQKVETIEVEHVSENKDGEEEEMGEKEVSLEKESEVVESKGIEEILKEEEVAGLSPSVQEITEENHVEVEHQSEENSEKEEVLDNDSDGEYMDMRVAQGSNMGASDSSSTTPNIPGLPDGYSNHTSTDIDEDNQELSEYVQDNFDFLDHMDSSFSNQMLEFSVEAPYPDKEEYEDRDQLLPQDPQYRAEPSVQLTGHSLTASTAETSTPKKTQTHSYRPLTIDRYDLPNKSLSLPYKTSPFFLTQFSSDEEDADADEDYSNDEENDMFYKSLPSGFFQHCSRPDIEDASNLSPVMSAQSPNHITELSPADQSEYSGVREPQLLEKESSASTGDLVRLEMDAKESIEKKDLRDTPIKTLEQSNESEGACQSAMLLEVNKSVGNPGDLTSECSTVDCVNSLLTGTADQNAEVTDSIVDVGDVMELYESHHFEVGESVSPHRDEGDATTAEASEIAGIHGGYTVPYDVESVNIFFESPDDQLDATSQVESMGELDRRKKRDDEINEISGEEKEKDEVSVEMRRESGREDVTEVLAEMGESNQQEQNYGECQRQPEEELGEGETEWKDGFCDKAISEADQMKMTEDENCMEDGEKNDRNENDWSAEAVVMETMQGVLKVEEEMEGRVAQNEGGVEDESSPVGETPEHRGTGETLPVWVELQNEISQENTFSENKVDFSKRKEVEDVNIERENQTPGCQVNYTQNEIFSLPQQETDPNDSKEQSEELRDKDKEEPQTPSVFEENVEDLKVIKPDNDALSEVKRAEKVNVQKMETGKGRVLVISKQSPAKVYQVRSVPVVPPKPQHCKLTALSLRQQQQERERRESHMDREDDNLVTATGATNNEKETETDKKLDVDKVIESEQGGQEEREDEIKERDVSKIGEVEKRLRDGDDRRMKEMPKNISISMCFDEAVAMVTMKRGREKENTERDKDKERRDMKQSSLEK